MSENARLHGYAAAAECHTRASAAGATGWRRKEQVAVPVLIAVCCIVGLATNAVLYQLGDHADCSDGGETDSLLVRKQARETVEKFFDQALTSLEGYVPQPPTVDIRLNCSDTVNGGDFSVVSPASNSDKERSVSSIFFSSIGGRLRVLRGGYYYVYIKVAKVNAESKQVDVDVVNISVVVNRAKSGSEKLVEALITLPSAVVVAADRKAGAFSARGVSLATGNEVHVTLRCASSSVKGKGFDYLCPHETCVTASLSLHMVANGAQAFAR